MARHGTEHYYRLGCRCSACRDANRRKTNAYRWRTGRHQSTAMRRRAQIAAELEAFRAEQLQRIASLRPGRSTEDGPWQVRIRTGCGEQVKYCERPVMRRVHTEGDTL